MYPGATVRIFEDSGGQPVFGTSTPHVNYVRFIEFIVSPGLQNAFRICGTGNEVAYNEVIGQYVNSGDNHDGIRIEDADSAWVHHNNIHGVTGPSENSVGIKIYKSTNLLVVDNYIHDNAGGIRDKDGGGFSVPNNNSYARNWLTNNPIGQFIGNAQGNPGTYNIYDNVIDGSIDGGDSSSLNNQIYNNLLRTSETADGGRLASIYNHTNGYRDNVWNNITIGGGGAIWGYQNHYVAFSVGQTTSPLAYMDYNFYDGAPSYDFNVYGTPHYTYTLSQFQSQGFETHSVQVASVTTIYQDTVSYVLKAPYTTAGRYGDPVGPRFPVAQILNTNRYGPGALN